MPITILKIKLIWAKNFKIPFNSNFKINGQNKFLPLIKIMTL